MPNSKRKVGLFGSIRVLAFSSLLCAMSVVIGIFCKTYLNFGTGLFRITFENLPILIAGIFYGPVIGAVLGAATDLISYLLSPQTYPPNLIVTAGAMAVGAVAGLSSCFLVKNTGYKKIIVSSLLAHAVGSMIIKPIGLFQFYGYAVLFRIPLYVVIAAFEILVLCLLYKNKNFRKIVEVRHDLH